LQVTDYVGTGLAQAFSLWLSFLEDPEIVLSIDSVHQDHSLELQNLLAEFQIMGADSSYSLRDHLHESIDVLDASSHDRFAHNAHEVRPFDCSMRT